MKIDKISKLLLAIIAINLTVIAFKDNRFGTATYANEIDYDYPEIHENQYGLVPLNNDGSITVKLSSYDELKVDIVDISTSDMFNVNLKDINTSDELNVNIDEIGGWSVYDKLPVEIK
ncbi:MAG: hypothetical protein AB8B74_10995 [Crocinitomicaceae bacterium]